MLLSRLSVEGSKLIGSTNPDSPMHWLKSDILDRFEVIKISYTIFILTLKTIQSLTEGFKPLCERNIRDYGSSALYRGNWVLAEGSYMIFLTPRCTSFRPSDLC